MMPKFNVGRLGKSKAKHVLSFARRLWVGLENLALVPIMTIYYMVGFLRASYYGVRVGLGARLSPRANIRHAHYLGKVVVGSDVTIGKGSYVNSGEIHSACIGSYCSIGYNVLIGPTEHIYKALTMSPYRRQKG